MKRFILAVMAAVVVSLGSAVYAQSNVVVQSNAPPLGAIAVPSFSITNITFGVGAIYFEGATSQRLGADAFAAYNLPKLGSASFAPIFSPAVGVLFAQGSVWSFNGTVSMGSRWYVLRPFDGGATSGFLHSFHLDPNIIGGVVQNVSGQEFGPIKAPGKAAPNGTGTGALTGYGISVRVGSIKGWEPELGYERFQLSNWTGVTADEFHLAVSKAF